MECPGCGVPVDDSARLCPRCGVPIATVRCAECFHMSPPSAALCTGCGRELGLAPTSEPDELSCPDCKRPFQSFRGGSGVLRDCAHCGGQLVDHELLAELLERREIYGKSAPRRPPRHNPLESPIRYVPCPACHDVMARRNFGGNSGVIVDICLKHGVWFDRGELPRVLAFVEAGGLELERERRALSARDARRTARVESVEQELGRARRASAHDRFHGVRTDVELAEASIALVSLLSGLLKGR